MGKGSTVISRIAMLMRVWLACLVLLSATAVAQTPVAADQIPFSSGAAPDEMQPWAGATVQSGGRPSGNVQTQPGADQAGDVGTRPRITGSYTGPGRIGRQPLTIMTMDTVAAVPAAPNDFQQFVVEATGKLLPIYGAEFFKSVNGYSTAQSGTALGVGSGDSRYAPSQGGAVPGDYRYAPLQGAPISGDYRYTPVQGVPVPGDYPLGPGDELLIRGWGSVDIDFRAVIDRDGLINIPKVGTISLTGVRAGNVEDVLRAAIGKVYRGFNLNVTYGQLRGITIYVVGQARRPGTYTVSSLSTLVTALFESGGPGQNGSLRHVQLKRAGKLATEIDLYAFLAHGDKSGDVKLMDGDVIIIPPASGYVALTGKIEQPGIYELRGKDDSLESLLEIAGGMPLLANPNRLMIEHIEPSQKQPRFVEELRLDAGGLKKTLKPGDLISILPISPEFANAVTLRVKNGLAFRMAFRPGMKITDLIPDKAALLSRAAVLRQNNFGHGLGDQYDDFNWDYAVVERLNRIDMKVNLVGFNLGRALSEPGGAENIQLQAGDTVTVFSADDVRAPIAKRRVFVRIEGEVGRPGVYQVEPGETLVNMVLKAGGLTPDAYVFAAEFYRESVRKMQQENLDKVVRRLEQQSVAETNKVVVNSPDAQSLIATQIESRNRFIQTLREMKSSGRMSLGISSTDTSLAQWPDLRLENGDRLVVPNRPDFIQVSGAVNAEASFLWSPGRTISDYLVQSGLTRDADQEAVFVVRADGIVLSNADRWFSGVAGLAALPGDSIVVPEKLIKESYWTAFVRNTKDVTQILYQFGLGAAAIKVLK